MRCPLSMPALACFAALVFAAAAAAEPLRLLEFAIDDPAVRHVVDHHTISRAMPATRFPGRRDHEEYLLDRLPLSAALGRRLHPALEPYEIAEKGPGLFEVEEAGRLRGPTRLVAGAPGRRVYLVEGEFRSLGELLRFAGSMVIALRYHEDAGPDGPMLVNEPHLYVRIDNLLLRGLAKLLSPVIHGIVERRVARLAAAAEAVSTRIARDPAGLYREMKAWPEITEAQRADFRHHFGIAEDQR